MRDDQARGLRRLFAAHPLHVAAVCGSNGTGVCIETAAALTRAGHGVCVLDRTVGEAARAIGRRAKYDLAQVLDGDCSLERALLVSDAGMHVLPAARGLERLGVAALDWRAALERTLPALRAQHDMWLVNGLLPGATPDAPVVLAIDASAAAITNAYGHIKALSRAQGRRTFAMIVEAPGVAAAERVHGCVADTARRFLSAQIELLGWIPPSSAHTDGITAARTRAFARIAERLMAGFSTEPLLRTGSC